MYLCYFDKNQVVFVKIAMLYLTGNEGIHSLNSKQEEEMNDDNSKQDRDE